MISVLFSLFFAPSSRRLLALLAPREAEKGSTSRQHPTGAPQTPSPAWQRHHQAIRVPGGSHTASTSLQLPAAGARGLFPVSPGFVSLSVQAPSSISLPGAAARSGLMCDEFGEKQARVCPLTVPVAAGVSIRLGLPPWAAPSPLQQAFSALLVLGELPCSRACWGRAALRRGCSGVSKAQPEIAEG